jgi:hypothetical protein
MLAQRGSRSSKGESSRQKSDLGGPMRGWRHYPPARRDKAKMPESQAEVVLRKEPRRMYSEHYQHLSRRRCAVLYRDLCVSEVDGKKEG